MKKEHFDEYQIMKRYKVGYQSFFITIVLIAINIGITERYMWAETDIQLYVIVMLSLMYFSTMAIIKNAYVSNRTKHPMFYAVFFAVFGLYSIRSHVSGIFDTGIIYLVENGQLTKKAGSMLYSLLLINMGVVAVIKNLIEKTKELKKSKEE